MQRSHRAAGLLTLALTAAVVASYLFGGPGAFALDSWHAAVPHGAGRGFLDQMIVAGPLAVAALRTQEADLGARAKAKLAEVVDGLAEDAVRAIEAEHGALLTQIEAVRGEIRAMEAPGTPPAPPAPTPAPAGDTQTAIRAERERTATILDIGRRSGLPQADIDAAVAGDTSVEAFRMRAFDHMATVSEAVRTGQGVRTQIMGAGDDEKRGAAIENALLHRFDPRGVQLTDHAREFRGMTLLEIGSLCLEGRGMRTRGMGKHERAQAMLKMRSEASEIAMRSGGSLSTSDFPNILANVANKTLRMGYQAAPQTFRPLVRVVTVPDFKPVSRVQLGEAPRLEKVNESGEFKRGKMGDAAEKYAVSTYGKIVAITRQVIINDDLDAFTRVPRSFGVAAANLESDLVWGEITANPSMADGAALFSADHKNVGTGGVISTDTVGAAREGMRNQTGLDGQTLLNISPTFLVVPVALETKAEQFLGMIYPTKTADAVTDTMRKLKPISEPRLDVVSKTNFYVFGDPAQIDLIELAYLEGAEGLYTETRMGFDVDGVEVKVRQDVGAKVIDHRGAWRSA
ncbi:prohead protease/major capsid protein fusion protein [uncultured Methylobacterium sp.]|jgi:phage major head subunit gpT-like protein|uniref:prohead protease/major capsid protein fusion protein n=1 Tax=uncultured Methylobacterium sp. TaxID=157278 RepID=UPI00260D9E93|nr:prohead protease/major capsid protein fusion protein [uncultured Methylobacterium sp.]